MFVLHRKMSDEFEISEFLRREQALRHQVELALNNNKNLRNNNNIDGAEIVSQQLDQKASEVSFDENGLSNPDMIMKMVFKNDYNSKTLREITYRRMTRYWLENQHLWSSKPLPSTGKYISFEPWKGGVSSSSLLLLPSSP